jgi:glycosyltransferase involved in cell wall biosynthesis
MLQRCLDSLFSQELPLDWEIDIVVVDNDPTAGLQERFPEMSKGSPVQVHYFAEPQTGIPYARNTACRESLRLGADWILFVDDDEEVEPGWLMAYRRASELLTADVYAGPARYLFPDGHAEWLANKGLWNFSYGEVLRRAATGNVMFSSKLLQPPFVLRFDTRLDFSGGSDVDFFLTAQHKGAVIRFVKDAVISERVAENRLRLSWRLQRQYASSASHALSRCKLYGFKSTLMQALPEVLRHILTGFLRLLSSPLFLLGGYGRFKRCYYHGLRHFAKSAGIVAGLIGRLPSPYRNPSGS